MAIKLARPDYAISRIDQAEKKNHGWSVRIQIDRIIHSKFFSDSLHGGKEGAHKAARKHRDSLISELEPERVLKLKQKPRDVPQSGVKGITHVVVQTQQGARAFWQVAWKDNNQRRRTKKFSVDDHGPRKSLRLAKEFLESGCTPGKRAKGASKKAAKR